MAKTSYLYEVLLRGGPDGLIIGAHQIVAERYIDDDTGEVITDRLRAAEPLDPNALEPVLSRAWTSSLNAVGELERLNAQMQLMAHELIQCKARADRYAAELGRTLAKTEQD